MESIIARYYSFLEARAFLLHDIVNFQNTFVTIYYSYALKTSRSLYDDMYA